MLTATPAALRIIAQRSRPPTQRRSASSPFVGRLGAGVLSNLRALRPAFR
jgi:hypothetical protein